MDNNKRIKASQALNDPFFSELFDINKASKKNNDFNLLKRREKIILLVKKLKNLFL